MIRRSVVLHGHFYQPPREIPWTDRVPREVSAAPYHDWNERVLAECYRPVTEARILGHEGRIRDVLNTLEWMSWDAGATLLRWLAREAPATYAAFLEADARSVARNGFGNALAAPYHHVILPLASRRDKVTEVRWGIADFRKRFGRAPQGMWLPETAVDMETLDVLQREGIAFTVLAPQQVKTSPAGGLPGRVFLGGGRSIAVFVYDGPLSHGVGFGSLLGDSEKWIGAIMERASEPGSHLVSLATDGETFGHHHSWADMALAATLIGLEQRPSVRLENYASFLARNPPVEEVTLVEPSSWSCVHGVERWRAECGCKAAPHEESQQEWRGVLRHALEELADGIHARYEEEAAGYFEDPWAARDAYGATLDTTEETRRAFAARHATRDLSEGETERALELLEAERDALRMFTSCGWFFDDLARLEPLQVLRYAAHAIDMLGESGASLEAELRERLADARSNDPEEGDGRRIWDERIRRTGSAVDAERGNGHPVVDVTGARRSGEERRQLRGAAVRDAPILTALRRFLRAPAADSARDVAAKARALGPNEHLALLAAQSMFAREVPRTLGSEEAVRVVARDLGFADAFFQPRALGGTGPVGFVFGLHLHQPVGNFDSVFRSHTDEVYLPFLEKLAERDLLPVTLHVSGPLLQWLEQDGHRLLDRIGALASDGGLELLLSGLYEPVLPALARSERLEQIGWMRDWIERKFGVEPSGLWLTERVWEPDLVEDLAEAGVRYAFVDDRHFLVAGHAPHTLHRPHVTESGGRTMSLLPIDEKLRYLVPFRPMEELERYFRGLRAEGQPLAILADDGEKFGGWPGTAEWVWESGWLDDFLDGMTRLSEEGVVRMLRGVDAIDEITPLGPSYLPSGSYSEMEGWSLPPGPAVARESLEITLGEAGASEAAARFLRGGHWRNFMSIYAESGRMHRKTALLAEMARSRDADGAVRHALGRARCNDAYWHGVFGGLYLKHLREAIWANLAEAEALLREDEPIGLETLGPGGEEPSDLWVHSHAFSSLIDLERGGAVTDLTHFAARLNLGDVLTRRWESYHRAGAAVADGGQQSGHQDDGSGGMASIHDLEERLGFSELPPYDPEVRTLTVERVLHGELDDARYANADYEAVRSWHGERPAWAYEAGENGVRVALSFEGPGTLHKALAYDEHGTLAIEYRWDPGAFPEGAWFAPELSLSREVELVMDPEPARIWRYEIRTTSKSERGAESSVQGVSLTPLWPCAAGKARITIDAGRIP